MKRRPPPITGVFYFMEIWKSIPNYEGLYEVSNLGNVKSLAVKKSYWSLKKPKEKILKPQDGIYYSVGLIKDGVNKRIPIHQLVALSFLNYNLSSSKLKIKHINSNKLDNRLSNIKIVSKNAAIPIKYKGIAYSEKLDKWKCNISINGIKKNLGVFKTKKEAINVYLAYESYKSKNK